MRPPDVSALVKIVLGVLWLGLARWAGAAEATALLAFAGGVFVIVFALFNDPRAALLPRRAAAAGAPEAGLVRQVARSLLPSTVGVSILAVAALAWRPALSAVLGGVCAGLGVAGLLHTLYRRP